MKIRKALLLTTVLLGLSSTALSAAELEVSDYRGWVISILGSDMIRVLDGGNRTTIVRLRGIDAPEKDQPYGKEAQSHLSGLVTGKEVKIKAKHTDDFGNILGMVLVEPPNCPGCEETYDVNLSLLESGLAWWAGKFASQQSSKHRKQYQEAEATARSEARGLWTDPDPIEPWHWREGARTRADVERLQQK